MRILITGGAGFVGSSLALHLRQAFSHAAVVCMDNLYRRGSELNLPRLQKAGIEFHRGDVRDVNGFPSGDLRIFVADCARLFERTQWRPKRDVRRIIQDISDWVANHSAELEPL